MRIFLIAAAILVCTEAIAQVYRWVDQEGKVHYTQTPPPPDAKNVQRKTFRGGGGGADVSNLPYATQVAAKNFPVTLYTEPECGSPCDRARALLVRRGIPFKEVHVVTQKDIDELTRLSGKNQLPLLIVGSQMQSGFREDLYDGVLDSAAYPASGPQLPLESLRTMAPRAEPVSPGQEPVPAR